MQLVQRFVGDQRFDLPNYESLVSQLSAEFHAYNKKLISPQNRIVDNWKVENNGGLQIRLNNTNDSFLFNTSGSLTESLNFRPAAYTLLTLNLVDNATNYVEIQLIKDTCAPDTVPIWDGTANAGTGEEFTQLVDTAIEIKPVLISNIIAFTGDTDKLRLARVVCSGGVIVSITDARQMLYELEIDWDFGVVRTDRTISSAKADSDAIKTIIKETSGTANWYDKKYSSLKLVKEYQNLFFTGGGVISWEGSNGANKMRWTQAIEILIAGRSNVYTINSVSSVTVLDNQAVYVDIPEGVPSGPLAVIVADMGDVPLNPSQVGYTGRTQVLFYRRNGKIYGFMDIPELNSGETASIGEDLPKDIRARLGILSETTFEAYSSNNIILSSDNYPEAISKMDAAFAAFANDEAKEERILVAVDATIFSISGFTFIDDNSKVDIQVTVNGVKYHQAIDGTSATGLYKKNSISEIEFFETISASATIVVRDERTGASISGGGGVDLTNITVSPQPLTNGSSDLGTDTKAWGAVFLKDQTDGTTYKLEVVAGVFQIVAI